ncbi:MAG: NACHT domain-containing protein [Candidatus Njordarchaeia archaeon]
MVSIVTSHLASVFLSVIEENAAKKILEKIWEKIKRKKKVSLEELKEEIIKEVRNILGEKINGIQAEMVNIKGLLSIIEEQPKKLGDMLFDLLKEESSIITSRIDGIENKQDDLKAHLTTIEEKMKKVVDLLKKEKEKTEKLLNGIKNLKSVDLEKIKFGLEPTIDLIVRDPRVRKSELEHEILKLRDIDFKAYIEALGAFVVSRGDDPYNPKLYVERGIEEEIISLIKASEMKRKKIILIVAEMGHGKTWLVSNIKTRLHRKGYTPIFLALREYDPLKVLNAEDNTELRWKLTRIENPVLILDGLDELYQVDREKTLRVIEIIRTVAETAEVPIILTTRKYEWDEIKADPRFNINNRIGRFTIKEIALGPFDEEKIIEALKKYNLPSRLKDAKGSLGYLLKKPFFIRLIAYWFKQSKLLPNDDMDNPIALTILTGFPKPKNLLPNLIFRVGISSEKLEELEEIQKKFAEKKIIPRKEIENEKNRSIIIALISAGILREEVLGARKVLKDEYGIIKKLPLNIEDKSYEPYICEFNGKIYAIAETKEQLETLIRDERINFVYYLTEDLEEKIANSKIIILRYKKGSTGIDEEILSLLESGKGLINRIKKLLSEFEE